MKIWPLYYFIVILSLFILPKFQVFKIPNLSLDVNNILVLLKVLALFLLMVPNLLVLIKLIQFATQTWSIGTEEQFYAIWPFIIDKVKTLEFLFFAIIILCHSFFLSLLCLAITVFRIRIFRTYYFFILLI